MAVGTCDFACWLAREDTCRFMCAGANHGIMRHGGEQPGRFCQRKGKQYRLEAIVADWYEARRMSFDRTWPDGYGPGKRCIYDGSFEQHATGGTLRWPEVENYVARHGDAYLVWARM